MKSSKILLLSLLLSLVYCKSKPASNESQEKRYTLVADEDGVVAEVFDSAVTDKNKYNDNNIIFKVGKTFHYNFKHITPEGRTQYFRETGIEDQWEFVAAAAADSATITSVKIEVLNGNPMADHLPDYNQTVLAYQMKNKNRRSMSGVIENEANVWMHPPRDLYFEILELNPFPYIKAPYQIGTSWTWHLTIGDGWSDKRWKLWTGQIENKYRYQITGKQTLKNKNGENTMLCGRVDGCQQDRKNEIDRIF
ncbi:hypothetical protein MVI27_02505 [Chryseobacterium salipaludis]|uniref:hypothetical protein n=1 Tax=Chryseobacterium TaxID=59732 RepID=UPI001FF0E5AA|nr:MULTISPECIES: hypothetical protein [Chryseobacterium]MCJ8497124.1 hypothetical protein [Chryseobacterium salipaludis]MCX3296606.1 hypothetical protein [Planobacterium sp. JC490]